MSTINNKLKKQHLDDYMKYKIIYLHEEKVSIRDICRRLKIARNTVRLWIRRYRETDNIKRYRPGAKPKMYTPESERHQAIVTRHVENPKTPTRLTALDHNISVKTVRLHLHAAGMKKGKPAPFTFTPAHREERVRFAKDYLNFDWEGNIVIFSDEKYFRSDKNGHNILWKKAYKQRQLTCKTKGTISLGYWAWMSSMGPGELVEVDGHLNSTQYLDILCDVMLPSVRIAYPDTDIYFVHDNCNFHRASIVQDWLASQEGVNVINWPSEGHDLNIIENLWEQIILKWDPPLLVTNENLADMVSSSWEEMRGNNLCWNMVSGMQCRLQQVIERDGAPLRYLSTKPSLKLS